MSVCDIETTFVTAAPTNVISTTVWVVETTLVAAAPTNVISTTVWVVETTLVAAAAVRTRFLTQLQVTFGGHERRARPRVPATGDRGAHRRRPRRPHRRR